MDLIRLSKFILDESRLLNLLTEVGLFENFEKCPYCKGNKVNKIRRGNYKCYCCRREWTVTKGTVLRKSRVPLKKFIVALKLFELEVSVAVASKELSLSYKTVWNLFMLFRKKIFEHTSKNDLLKHNGNKKDNFESQKLRPYFGITKTENGLKIEIFKSEEDIEKFKVFSKGNGGGSIVCIESRQENFPFEKFRFIYKRYKIDEGKGSDNYFKEIENFWWYIRNRLIRYPILNFKTLDLLLKELEFRYNCKNNDLFFEIIKCLKE